VRVKPHTLFYFSPLKPENQSVKIPGLLPLKEHKLLLICFSVMKPYYKDIEINRRATFKLKENSPAFLEYNEEIKGSVLRLDCVDSITDPILVDLYKMESYKPTVDKIDVWVVFDNYGEEINIPYEDIEAVEYLEE
jgi:hypothetical protein